MSGDMNKAINFSTALRITGRILKYFNNLNTLPILDQKIYFKDNKRIVSYKTFKRFRIRGILEIYFRFRAVTYFSVYVHCFFYVLLFYTSIMWDKGEVENVLIRISTKEFHSLSGKEIF
jgi:hypothetical protein